MNDKTSTTTTFDPFSALTGIRDGYLDAWAKVMTDWVNSEAYAEGTAKMLDNYLTISAPFREALEKTMTRTLEQLSMPSRGDVTSVAERVTNVELKLDDMDAKIDDVNRAAKRSTGIDPKLADLDAKITDVMHASERLTDIERKLGDLDAKIDAVIRAVERKQTSEATPSAQSKPPAEAKPAPATKSVPEARGTGAAKPKSEPKAKP